MTSLWTTIASCLTVSLSDQQDAKQVNTVTVPNSKGVPWTPETRRWMIICGVSCSSKTMLPPQCWHLVATSLAPGGRNQSGDAPSSRQYLMQIKWGCIKGWVFLMKLLFYTQHYERQPI